MIPGHPSWHPQKSTMLYAISGTLQPRPSAHPPTRSACFHAARRVWSQTLRSLRLLAHSLIRSFASFAHSLYTRLPSSPTTGTAPRKAAPQGLGHLLKRGVPRQRGHQSAGRRLEDAQWPRDQRRVRILHSRTHPTPPHSSLTRTHERTLHAAPYKNAPSHTTLPPTHVRLFAAFVILLSAATSFSFYTSLACRLLPSPVPHYVPPAGPLTLNQPFLLCSPFLPCSLLLLLTPSLAHPFPCSPLPLLAPLRTRSASHTLRSFAGLF